MKKLTVLTFAFAAFSLSCTPTLKYARIGAPDAVADAEVMRDWKSTPNDAGGNVKLAIDALPKGISLENGFSVQPGYAHRIIGNFKLAHSFNPHFSYQTLQSGARRLASVVGGDFVIARYIGPSERGEALGIAGVIVKLDPNVDPDAVVPTTMNTTR